MTYDVYDDSDRRAGAEESGPGSRALPADQHSCIELQQYDRAPHHSRPPDGERSNTTADPGINVSGHSQGQTNWVSRSTDNFDSRNTANMERLVMERLDRQLTQGVDDVGEHNMVRGGTNRRTPIFSVRGASGLGAGVVVSVNVVDRFSRRQLTSTACCMEQQ